MNVFSDFIKRYKRVRKEHGFVGMFFHYLRRTAPVYKSSIFRTNRVRQGRHVPDLCMVRCRTISEICSHNIEPFIAHSGKNALKEFEKISSTGAESWIGYINNHAVGICWSKFGKTKKDYFVPLNVNDATISSCFVFSEFRGRGIYPAMIREIANTRISEGAACVYIDCKAWNTASARGIQKAGFDFLGSAWRISMGRWNGIFQRRMVNPLD